MGWSGLEGSTAEVVLIAPRAPCQGVLGKRLLVRHENSTWSAHDTNKEAFGPSVRAPESKSFVWHT